MKTAFIRGSCTWWSEAIHFMCHTVSCLQTLRRYGRQKKKVQHQIKTVFYPQLPEKFGFVFVMNDTRSAMRTHQTLWRNTIYWSAETTEEEEGQAWRRDWGGRVCCIMRLWSLKMRTRIKSRKIKRRDWDANLRVMLNVRIKSIFWGSENNKQMNLLNLTWLKCKFYQYARKYIPNNLGSGQDFDLVPKIDIWTTS